MSTQPAVMSSPRVAGREHIPKYPPAFVVLPSVQIFITLVVIGLAAYAVSGAVFAGGSLMLFTCIVTLVVLIWETTALTCAPAAYNYWATLVLTIWLFILWLCSFALLAAEAAIIFADGSTVCDSYDSYDSDYYGSDDYCYGGGSLSGQPLTHAAVVAAASGLGALQFLLFFTALVIHSVVVCRHRRAGLHSRPVGRGIAHQQPYQMHPVSGGVQPSYQAVPQQGMPLQQQNTAYNPHQMYYNPAQQQGAGGGMMGYQGAPPAGYYGIPELEKTGFARNSVSPAPANTAVGFQQPASPPIAHGAYQVPPQYGGQGTPQQQTGPYQPPHQQQQQQPYQGQPYQGQPHHP